MCFRLLVQIQPLKILVGDAMVVVALLLIQVKPLVQFKVPHKLAQAKQLVKFEAQKQLEVHNAHNCFF